LLKICWQYEKESPVIREHGAWPSWHKQREMTLLKKCLFATTSYRSLLISTAGTPATVIGIYGDPHQAFCA
jgi:hypothetical protein